MIHHELCEMQHIAVANTMCKPSPAVAGYTSIKMCVCECVSTCVHLLEVCKLVWLLNVLLWCSTGVSAKFLFEWVHVNVYYEHIYVNTLRHTHRGLLCAYSWLHLLVCVCVWESLRFHTAPQYPMTSPIAVCCQWLKYNPGNRGEMNTIFSILHRAFTVIHPSLMSPI